MKYDLIIIGQGPAGISAGIYAARYKINTLLIGQKPGGQVMDAYRIENYPGIPNISGLDLMEKFQKHLQLFALPSKQETVLRIQKSPIGFAVITDKNKYQAKTIIYALGSQRRKLEIPGETELLGKGVGYCTVCDAFFFKDKITAVIGGSDGAASSAMQLAEIGKKVYLIFRDKELIAMPAWAERVKKNPKIILVPNTNILKIKGKNTVESIELDHSFRNKKELAVDGVFIEIGVIPINEPVRLLGVKIDKHSYIQTNQAQETNIQGFFAAGDSTTGSNKFHQIITAAAEGAIAADSVFKYLKNRDL